MGKYNSNLYLNKRASDNGMTTNYMTVRTLKSISELLSFSDSAGLSLVKALMRDSFVVDDNINTKVTINTTDYFGVIVSDEQIKVFTTLLDNFGIKDEIEDILCYLYITDDSLKFSENFSLMVKTIVEENMFATDDFDVNVFIQTLEDFGLLEEHNLTIKALLQEYFSVKDSEPRVVETDFIIGNEDGKDNRWRWLLPFDLMIDEVKSSISVMPIAESTYFTLPGVDGDIMTDTRYRNRFFNLVGQSVDGLSQQEKDELFSKITRLLDETKEAPKRLTNSRTGATFEVKYSGEAKPREAPSWIQMEIPFEANPYGYRTFPNIFEGDGLIVNDGDKSLGAIISIKGYCANPAFLIGSHEIRFNLIIQENETLVMDNQDMTTYVVNLLGEKRQAKHLMISGDYVIVEKGKEVAVSALTDDTRTNMTTTYNPPILYYGKEDVYG